MFYKLLALLTKISFAVLMFLLIFDHRHLFDPSTFYRLVLVVQVFGFLFDPSNFLSQKSDSQCHKPGGVLTLLPTLHVLESGHSTPGLEDKKIRARPYCVENKRLCVFDMLGTELSHKRQKNGG